MAKEEAHTLAAQMSEKARWDDVMHQTHVRQGIERDLADSHTGRMKSVSKTGNRYRIAT